jgi:hypothetical protein
MNTWRHPLTFTPQPVQSTQSLGNRLPPTTARFFLVRFRLLLSPIFGLALMTKRDNYCPNPSRRS